MDILERDGEKRLYHGQVYRNMYKSDFTHQLMYFRFFEFRA